MECRKGAGRRETRLPPFAPPRCPQSTTASRRTSAEPDHCWRVDAPNGASSGRGFHHGGHGETGGEGGGVWSPHVGAAGDLMIHDGAAFGPAGRRTGFAPKGPRVPRGEFTCQEPPSSIKTRWRRRRIFWVICSEYKQGGGKILRGLGAVLPFFPSPTFLTFLPSLDGGVCGGESRRNAIRVDVRENRGLAFPALCRRDCVARPRRPTPCQHRTTGASTSGKSQGFDPCIRRFESYRPSQRPAVHLRHDCRPCTTT